MSLQSKLFRGDRKLEACLLNDPDHIVNGAVGEHVAKIQSALSQIDNLSIQQNELAAKMYGPSTSAAVLAFKRQRQIINRTYQTQADDIVGKMTIAALDGEMLTRENRRTPSLHCGDPIGGGGGIAAQRLPSIAGLPRTFGARTQAAFPIQRLTSLNDAAPPSVPKVFSANLDVLWQITSAAAARGGQKHLTLLLKAISLLKPFGLDIVSSVSSGDPPFPNQDFVDARFREDAFKVRKAAESVRPGLPRVLRIIVCPFEPSSPEFGITEGGTLDGVSFPAFVLINVNKFRTDQCTALHEMIHATGLFDHDDDATMGDSVFSTASNRSVLRPEHAERLSKAFFAKPK